MNRWRWLVEKHSPKWRVDARRFIKNFDQSSTSTQTKTKRDENGGFSSKAANSHHSSQCPISPYIFSKAKIFWTPAVEV